MHDFRLYDLIIDARSPHEYAEDHIPGAVNLPVVDDQEFAEVGIKYRTDQTAAYQIGASYSLKNVARHIEQCVSKYDASSRVLVYCFRGGKRSRVWHDVLDTIGYRVEKLPGGWKAYRRWVNEQLASVPGNYRYIVLSGATGSGKTRLLAALREAGAQVLDLEQIAVHRGSIIGGVPGQPQPTQKMFDSLLLRELAALDPQRPVWIEAESKKIGQVQVPEALLRRMREGTTVALEAPMSERIKLLREDYCHFEQDPQAMLDRLSGLRPLVGGAEFEQWQALADAGRIPELLERLMATHYDPTYRRSTLRNYPGIDNGPKVTLDDLSPAALLPVARAMRERFESAGAATSAPSSIPA